MTIYELRCAWWNYESDEDDYYGNSIIGLYATKELAENATKNLDVLKISRSEFSKFVKEYDREGLDKINLGVYYENPYADTPTHHNYIRGVKIYDDHIPPLNTWCFLFEVVEHELIGS